MKVTKIIKEYIEEAVFAKVDENPEYQQARKESDEAQHAYREELDKIIAEANQKIADIADKHGTVYINYSGDKEYPCVYVRNDYRDRMELALKATRIRNELNKKAKEKIREIIFRLEMGGKKEEIQSMLDEVEL